MRRPERIRWQVLATVALPTLAAWWGCAAGSPSHDTTTSSSSTSSGAGGGMGGGGSSAFTASSSSGGVGGFDGTGGGGGDVDGGGVCRSKSVETHFVPVDLMFLIDRSGSMSGPKWMGITSALTAFFVDPQSVGLGAGVLYFPTSVAYDCDYTHYEALDVPIAPLPGNAFPLTNSIPADATYVGTPIFGALKGALYAATSYQDAFPAHRVNVVLATDGDANGCTGEASDVSITAIASLAASALNYNGVHTYTIGVQGAAIDHLNEIAAAGGTNAAYDVTMNISQFASAVDSIRKTALGCNYQIPPPPKDEAIDYNKVNFAYTPGGMGTADTLPRATDESDCGNEPGWYYDSNAHPTEIILCPASCSTVTDDTKAKVSVLFGCKAVLK